MSRPVVVIGAGVSGLAAAADLVARGYGVTVLERQVGIGGNAKSERFGGFLMEHGPTTLNAAYPRAMDCLRALGLAASAESLGPGVRKRYLRDGDTLHGISTHPLGFFLSGYLSPGARLSLATEVLRPRRAGTAEETIHEFVSRRFGAEFASKVIEPLAAGIFMGDSRMLSVSGAFPKLVELEDRFGSVMRGVIAAKRGSEPGRRLFSWPGGVGTLTRALGRTLGGRIHTGVAVTKISRSRRSFEVRTAGNGTLSAGSVVLAVQPHVAAALLEPLDPQGAGALGEIAAPPVAVVFLGYRRAQVSHPLDGLGFLCTKGDTQLISGAQFSSTMFGGRAPDGHVAISCYVGGTRNPHAAALPARELIGAVHGELAGVLQIAGDPVVARTRHWPRGLPQYTIGHHARRTVIETAHRRVPGLYLTGNYLSGVSVTGCLEQAGATAELLVRQKPAQRHAAAMVPAPLQPPR